MNIQRIFWMVSVAVFALVALASYYWRPAAWSLLLFGPLFLIGVRDLFQTRQAVRRNYPVIGNFRYLFELIRPEINQYFVESEMNGRPFSREMRSIVYQRAKRVRDTQPFGTKHDLYEVGSQWMAHSMAPVAPPAEPPRIRIGGPDCKQPYEAALLNVSAMSFGSLSKNAILALNGGAARGGFYHNTGEGGVSKYHLEPGGDLVWQIGTGYFGCRDAAGNFCPENFQRTALLPNIKMVEIKISQGAKPGHGGILPAAKITPEIAEIRGVSMGHDVNSPPAHKEFSTPLELIQFIARLRDLSGGKPIGIKFCLGVRYQFAAICKAMLESAVTPDFISIDGAEGGTGAAPLEFANSLGAPLEEGLAFVHSMLVGFGLRDRIKIIASGRIITGFNMAERMAIGADLCCSARGMMFSLGCIQALTCNSNHCPVGVATQEPHLVRGLDVADKTNRVANYQAATVHALMDLLGASGISHPDQLNPRLLYRRVSETQVMTFNQIFPYLEEGELLSEPFPAQYRNMLKSVRSDSFHRSA